MKKNIIGSLIFIICITINGFAWDKMSMGIMGESGNSVTFMNNNNLYGLDLLTFSLDSEDAETALSAYIFMPKIGKRFNLRSVNRIHSYFRGEINLVIPIISIDIDGENTAQLEDDIKDIVDMLGFKFAYGIEYKFNEQLSFSTDYGFNYLWNNIIIEGSDLSARLGHSYTLLSLNFSGNSFHKSCSTIGAC